MAEEDKIRSASELMKARFSIASGYIHYFFPKYTSHIFNAGMVYKKNVSLETVLYWKLRCIFSTLKLILLRQTDYFRHFKTEKQQVLPTEENCGRSICFPMHHKMSVLVNLRDFFNLFIGAGAKAEIIELLLLFPWVIFLYVLNRYSSGNRNKFWFNYLKMNSINYSLGYTFSSTKTLCLNILNSV